MTQPLARAWVQILVVVANIQMDASGTDIQLVIFFNLFPSPKIVMK